MIASRCPKHDITSHEEFCFIDGCIMVPINPRLAEQQAAQEALRLEGDYI